MKIELELPETLLRDMGKFLIYKKWCDQLNPDIDPVDKVAVEVYKAFAPQLMAIDEERDANEV